MIKINKKIVAILGVFVIAVVIASSGCIFDFDGGSSANAEDIAKMTPEGASSLIYFNLQTIRNDKDLDDIYERYYDIGKYEYYNVALHDVNYGAGIDGVDRITIIGGKFNLRDVRDELDDAGLVKDDYKDVELWRGGSESVAISGDMLISGFTDSVKRCIRVMKGREQSVYDGNDDFRDVIDKLPGGITTRVVISDEYYKYEGELVGGSVVIKKDEDTLKLKGVIKFEDEDNAEDAKSKVKRDLKKTLDDVVVKQIDEFLKVTGIVDIGDWKKVM